MLRSESAQPNALPRSRPQPSELQQSLRDFVEAIDDGVILLDDKLNVSYANPAAQNAFSLEPALSSPQNGTSLADIFPGDGGAMLCDRCQSVLGTAQPFNMEHTVDNAKNGTTHLSIKAFKIGEGLGLTVSDITAHVHAEDALRSSEDQFRAVFDNSALGLALLTSQGQPFRINPAMEQMLGYTLGDLQTAPMAPYADPADALSELKAFADILSGKCTHRQVEKRYACSDGALLWGRVTFSTVRDSQGNLRFIVTTVEDITEAKLAKDALRESEERYRLVVENANEAIFVAQDGALQFLNAKAADMTGYSREQLLSTPFADFIHPEDRPLVVKRHKLRLKGERTPHVYPFRIIGRRGDIKWAEINAVAFTWHGKPATLNFLNDITARKRAEQALRHSEAQMRAIFHHAAIGLALLDKGGRIVQVNPAMRHMLGLPAKEIRDTMLTDYLIQDDATSAPQLLHEMVSGKPGHCQVEQRYLRKDGTTGVGHVTVSPVRDLDGELQFAIAILEDISDRKDAEDALRESERNYRILFDSVQEGLVVVDAETKELILANQTAARMYEFDTVAELLEANILDHMHPDERERALEIVAHDVIQNDLRQVNDFRTLTRRGTERWISAVGSNIDYHGRPAVLGSFSDITNRKRAEEELTRHRKHLEKLIEERTVDLTSANRLLHQEITERTRAQTELKVKDSAIASSINAIAITDAEGRVLYVNDAFLSLWGYDDEHEVLGQPAETFWRMGPKAAALLDAFRDTRNWTGDLVAKRKDSTFFDVLVSASTIQDETGTPTCFMASFIDITDRKRYEAKLEKLYAREKKLRQQIEEEMNRRVEFTRALAHELKTPLTPVLMSSQVLASQLTDPTMLRLANNVSRGAVNLNNRIDELLDLAKGEIGMLHLKPEPVDIFQLLRDIIEDVSSLPAARSQSFVSKLPPSLPPSLPLIWADRTRLRQIILNLLNNAFKYTPEHGKITLSARHDHSNLIIEVHDTGPGVSKEEQQRLFEPYHRLESDRERLSGLGLGLALSKTLVELHGGLIWVHSSPNKGSTFAFSLPLDQHPHPESGG